VLRFAIGLLTATLLAAAAATGAAAATAGGGGLWLRAGRRAIVSATALYSVRFVNVSWPDSFTSRLLCTNLLPPYLHCPHYCDTNARRLHDIRSSTPPPNPTPPLSFIEPHQYSSELSET